MLLLTSILFVSQIDTRDLLDVNLYQVINVGRNATDKKIAQQYRKYLNERSHPDRLTKHELRTEKAFETLGYEDSRALYDFTGGNFLNATRFEVMGYQSDETLREITKLVGTLPDEISKYGGMLTFPVQWDLLDFMTGAEKEIKIIKYVKCRCPNKEKKCDTCTQTPYVEKLVKGTVRLPPGAPEYFRTIGKGFGDTPTGRGAADIIFVAYSRPDKRFQRRGADLYVNASIRLQDLLVKKSLDLEMIDGQKIQLDLKNWIARGCVGHERIVGRGLPRPIDPSQRGDLVVELTLVMPGKLTAEQKAKLSAAASDDPNMYHNINADLNGDRKTDL